MVAEDEAEAAAAQEPRQPLLAVTQGQGAEVLAVELQEVEGVSMASLTVPLQSIEDRDAVRTSRPGLAVERERSGPQLVRRGGDRRVAAAQGGADPLVGPNRIMPQLAAAALRPACFTFGLIVLERRLSFRYHPPRAGRVTLRLCE